jgi:hypothetical protein
VSEKQATQRATKQDPPDFRIHKLEKIVADGDGRKKYPASHCKVCAAREKESETSYICKFCIVPFHKLSFFEKYHSVRKY